MLAALALDEGIVAADVVEGSFTQDLFIKSLWDDVVCIHSLQLCILVFFVHVCSGFSQLPLTTPHPGPRSVILIDNARIHHHPDIIELVESYGT